MEAEFIEAHDPYEDFNRRVYAFNDLLDQNLIKPLSQGYQAIVPPPLNQGISNVFANLTNPTSLINSLLQNKFHTAGQITTRFAINSTVGLGGLFDVATDLGLPASKENFAQTLGVWGLEPGPYVVLPLLGPSTATGMVGRFVDWWSNPLNALANDTPQYSLRALSLIDRRAALLPLSRLTEQALDPYAFVRDAYLQQHRYAIRDGAMLTPDDWDDETY